jgi:hypothetical protein
MVDAIFILSSMLISEGFFLGLIFTWSSMALAWQVFRRF